MKKFTFLFLFFILCTGAQAAVTRMQVVSKNCSNGVNCTVNIAPVQQGDLIVVTSLVRNDTTQITPTVTDSQSNTYNTIWYQAIGGHYAYTMSYLANVTNAPFTVTVNLTPGGLSVSMIVVEYSGVVASNPLDVSTITTANSGASYASASIKTNSANELLVGAILNNAGVGETFTGATGTGWTNFASLADYPSGNTLGMQDEGVTSVGSYANTGTASASQNTVGMAAFVTTQAPASIIPTPAVYYIRPGATGNNSGSDWNNAFTDFPGATSTTAPTMVRGATYYVASGNYNSYLFNTPESGTSVITIKKATATDYGTSVGWNPAYGTGRAVFGNARFNNRGSGGYWNFLGVNFATGYWTFDGNANGGSNPSGYGFTFLTDSSGNAEYYVNVTQQNTYNFNGMTIRNTAVTCTGPSQDHEQYGILAGNDASLISPTIEYNYVSNCQISLNVGGSSWLIEHNYFINGWSSTDNHGVLIDVFSGDGTTFAYNYLQGCVYDCMEANGGVNAATFNNWYIYGNVFNPQFQTPVGIVSGASTQVVTNTHIYNNTIINSTGALLWEQDIGAGPIVGTGNVVENNLFYGQSNNAFVTNGGNPITYEYNSWWSSSVTQTGTGDQVMATGNPFVSLSTGDYHPILHTAPGVTLGSPYNLDPAGTARGIGGNWDMGAYQTGKVYYIDYNNGSDSNNGASESSPWKLAPGMKGFTGTYTHQAGDHFIFKGGVTWPYTAFPWTIANGGSSSVWDYYGVDRTWSNGSAGSRPIFDFGGSANPNRMLIAISGGNGYTSTLLPANITFDNLEMTDFYWDATYNGAPGYFLSMVASTNSTFENCYFHNWTHSPCTSNDGQGNCTDGNGSDDAMSVIFGGCSSLNNIFDGRPNGTDSGLAAKCLLITGSTAEYMSNGFLPSAGSTGIAVISHNNIGPIDTSYSGSHENAIEPLGFGANYIYDNIIHDTTAVTILTEGGNGSSGIPETDYIWNNLIYNSPPIPIQLDTVSDPGGSAVYMYNNTILANGTSACFRVVNRGNGNLNILDLRNNLCISTSSSALGIDAGGGVNTLTNSSNLLLTPTQATADQYILSNNLIPTSSTSPTVGAGVNLSSLGPVYQSLDSDLLGNPRPSTGAWDIGAYQYTGSGSGTGGGGNVSLGDVNGDGQVSIMDAEMAAQSSIGLITLTPTQQQAAEVDGKTSVDSNDANLIAEYVVGSVTSL